MEFRVKYSPSCPITTESFMIINQGEQYIKPPRFNRTFVRLNPGKYNIKVSHPWCYFYPVSLYIKEDGTFKAESNTTTTKSGTIEIQHEKLEDPTDLFTFKNLQTFGTIITLFFVGTKFCKPKLAEIAKQAAEQQKLLLEEQQRLQQQQQQNKKPKRK